MPKLTKSSVEEIKATDKDQFVWDSDIPGFGLRVKPSGSRSYLIQYRDGQGRSKRLTIGQHGKITAEQARSEAKRQFARITLNKSDPRAERDETRSAISVKQLANEYLEAAEAGTINTRRGKPKSASTLLVDRGRVANHITPILGQKPARDLEVKDIMALFAQVKSGRTAKSGPSGKLRGRVEVTGGAGTAKKAVTLLSAILAYGVKVGAVSENIARGSFTLPKDGQRQVIDPEGMLRALGRALALAEANGENPKAISAIRLAALTGMRAGEIIGLKLSEIDLPNNALRLTETKTGKSVRPLNEQARAVIYPLRMAALTPFIFPADRGEGHYGGLPAAVRRICRADYLDDATRATLSDFSLHIARHIFASIANAHGISEHTIGAFLGHANGSITSKYISPIDRPLLIEANKAARAVANLLNEGKQTVPDAPEGEEYVLDLFEGDHEACFGQHDRAAKS